MMTNLKDYVIIGSLAFSGLLITAVSAFFSIKGFVLFIPDPELYWGLVGLGFAFELAKIAASTFLFHRMGDSGFPMMFKVIMTSCVLSLVIFSATFTFVHLNASASKSLAASGNGSEVIGRLEDRNKVIDERIKSIADEIASISSESPSAKIRMYNKLNPERETLQAELQTNMERIDSERTKSLQGDDFVFLTNLSEFTGQPKDTIFFAVTAFIVVVIDPLAISLFLCASYIFAGMKKEEKVVPISSHVPVSAMEYVATPSVSEERRTLADNNISSPMEYSYTVTQPSYKEAATDTYATKELSHAPIGYLPIGSKPSVPE